MRSRKGQGAVEFALLLPFLLAVTLLTIEFAFYFGAIHYDNFAAFSAARALEGGGDASIAGARLMDGNIHDDVDILTNTAGVSVRQPWDPSFYGEQGLLGDMDFTVTVNLGRNEADYEGTISNLTSRFADNNVVSY